MSQQEIEITAMSYGGRGIGHAGKKVWFIDDTIPGDLVMAAALKEGKRHTEATIKTFITRSPLRTAAACPQANECGGCQWQEAPYAKQLEWKKEFVTSALQRVAKLDYLPSFTVSPSPSPLYYRNRVQLKGFCQRGKLSLGYYRKRSHTIVAVEHCPIAGNLVNRFLELFTKQSLAENFSGAFFLELQAIFDSGQPLIANFSTAKPDPRFLKALTEAARATGLTAWVNDDVAKEPTFFAFDKQDGLTFYTTPGVFQQVNLAHNHNMRCLVKTWVKGLPVKNVLDVYCGSGNFSLPLAQDGLEVHGIEYSAAAIACAKYSAEKNQLHATYNASDAREFLVRQRPGSFDLVLVDPPREGLKDATPLLLNLGAPYIIYISCDPQTLARDLAALKNTYVLAKLMAFDFFPQTYHIETVTLLKKLNP